MKRYKAICLRFDRGTLLLTGIGLGQAQNICGRSFWTWDSRVGALRCDAIHYAAVRSTLTDRLGASLVDDVPRPQDVHWPKVKLVKLRDSQRKALDAWTQGGNQGQIIMPTGTGKTEVALAAMARTKTATLIVAPVRDLMYQWHRRILAAFEYDAGIVGDGLSDIKPITVTTYDSAYIHMGKMGAGFGLLIFDEEHHLPGRCRREAAILSTAPMRLGLTATPERSDGLHEDLDWLIGPVVYRMPFREAEGSTLANFAKFLPALLACKSWRMTACIKTPWNTPAKLLLSAEDGFTSHLPSPDEFDSALEESFAKKFGNERDGWRLIREGEILHDRQKTFIPDFTFRHKDGTQVLLEIVGFWTPEYLERKRQTLQQFRHQKILIAVPEKSIRDDAHIGERTLVYKTAIKIEPMMKALERIRTEHTTT